MRLPLFLLLLPTLAPAQPPTISPGGIVNHFSYALPGMPNAGIAQGAIFDLYGENIGPASLAPAPDFPLPTLLAGTSVQVTVAGTSTDVLLFFVAPNQIVGLLPSRTPVGVGSITVTVNGTRGPAAPISVVARAIGVLSLAQNGQGPAVMQITDATGQLRLNAISNLAQPGQVGVFYATGLGAVPFDESRGAPVLALGPPVEAFVDDKPAKVIYQGRVPGQAGLDQFNVEIPPGINSCYAAVWFQSGNVLSNITTISVSSGLSCPDPLPPTVGGGTGTRKAAVLRLQRAQLKFDTGPVTPPLDFTSDSALASFSVTDLSSVPVSTPIRLPLIGGCFVGTNFINVNDPRTAFDNGNVTYYDAGPIITLTGPNGVKQLVNGPSGYVTQLGSTPFPGQMPAPPPPYLSPGLYTFDNGPGTADVPPFSARITLPQPPFAWTNADANPVVPRANGLELTWTGADQSGFVDVTGYSLLPRSATQPIPAGGFFFCRVPASVGRFRIPAQVLLFLPPSVVLNGVSSGNLGVALTSAPVNFPLPGFPFFDLVHFTLVSRAAEFR